LFRHGDLDTLNVIPVPDRLQEAVGEAKEKKIEDGFFAKVMVNTKDARFREHSMKSSIQLLR